MGQGLSSIDHHLVVFGVEKSRLTPDARLVHHTRGLLPLGSGASKPHRMLAPHGYLQATNAPLTQLASAARPT